jgi:hypothetical protein
MLNDHLTMRIFGIYIFMFIIIFVNWIRKKKKRSSCFGWHKRIYIYKQLLKKLILTLIAKIIKQTNAHVKCINTIKRHEVG